MPNNQRQKPLNVAGRLFGSTTACLLGCLFLFDLAARAYMPEDNVDKVYFTKFNDYFHSSKNNPVLLLGSSVVASAAYNADLSIDNQMQTTPPDNRVYDKARYLEGQLTQNLQTACTVENLSCPGCMTSDAWTILSKAVAFHKTPKVVIYELFPRDVMDPNMPDLGKTPYWIHLGKMHAGQFDYLQQSAAEFSEHLSSISKNIFTDPKSFSNTLRNFWYYFSVRSNFSKIATNWAEHSFHRQSSLYAAAAASGTLVCAPPATKANGNGNAAGAATADDADLPSTSEAWTRVDWTPHKARLAQELPYLSKMLDLCQKNHIKMVVVNMPITKRYAETILSPALRATYKQELASRAQNYGGIYIDLYDDTLFTDSDFKDLTHTNASGGRKVQESLSRALAKYKSDLGLASSY